MDGKKWRAGRREETSGLPESPFLFNHRTHKKEREGKVALKRVSGGEKAVKVVVVVKFSGARSLHRRSFIEKAERKIARAATARRARYHSRDMRFRRHRERGGPAGKLKHSFSGLNPSGDA